MKYKYFILINFCLLIINIILLIKNFDLNQKANHDYLANKVISIDSNTTTLEKKIEEKSNDPKYKIKIYYPYTPYNTLNKEIGEKISTYIQQLKDAAINNKVQLNQYYTIDILYDSYCYQNYISYVFYISIYTGGAHPNNTIWTITYDTNSDKIITIKDLIEKNKNILNILSMESKHQLKKEKRFLNQNDIIDSMLEEGTKPTNENFKNFAVSNNGLLIFFEQYQIAPYSFGQFEITIPYSKLF